MTHAWQDESTFDVVYSLWSIPPTLKPAKAILNSILPKNKKG